MSSYENDKNASNVLIGYFFFLLASVVTSQPQPANFVEFLDVSSRTLYSSLNNAHNTGTILVGKVNNAGAELMAEVQQKFTSEPILSIQQLLEGLLKDNETIVSKDPHLKYKSFTITDEFGSEKETREGGSALLTNQRLVLLSSQVFEKSTVTQYGNPKVPPGGYTAEMLRSLSIYYFPIPLELLRSIEIGGKSGISGSIKIDATIDCCCCYCPKVWNKQPMIYNAFKDTSIKLGVLMPPWEHKSFLILNVENDAPVYYIRDFVSILQRVAKEIK